MSHRPRSWRAPALLLAVVLAGGVLAAVAPTGADAGACPPGYRSAAEQPEARRLLTAPGFQGPAELELDEVLAETGCIAEIAPESFADRALAAAERTGARTAPYASLAGGAFESGAGEAALLQAGPRDLPGSAGAWEPYGEGPLQAGDEGYGVAALGLVELGGRPTGLAPGPESETVYASVSNGGVWRTDDLGGSWRSIGDTLPTQVVGGIDYTPAGGGTVVVVTGDDSFGANSYEGLGAYWSSDDGATWTRAEGVPADAFGFTVAVDPANPEVVYAATGTGLFRSGDAGRTFTNVVLPVGECAGMSNRAEGCLFDNIVTDVVVQAPGGTGDAAGGAVAAAVGWRAGNRTNPDGTVQSPGNGIYLSETGEPDSFTKSGQAGFTPQENIGRIELGAAIGEGQDHGYLYAVVQDAVLFNDGAGQIDAPEVQGGAAMVPTNFNGVYVSSDFGSSWTLMASAEELQSPTTGSALAVVAQSSGFGPGVQSWYDMWVAPDPTSADPLGVPTRLAFGLEEVWQNEVVGQPQNAKSSFKVVGRYFAGETCLFLNLVPACPTDRENALADFTTTHPDQHAALWVPHDESTTLLVANDGGAYTNDVPDGGDIAQTGWGVGANRGFNTLLPYDAHMAADGTVWMGLQDNGTAKIQPDGRKVMAGGGDGFFTAVDPSNSDVAYGETPFASMSVTTDGGFTFSSLAPPVTNSKFSNPFMMDPQDPLHLITAGREVVETVSGPGTGSFGWIQVFDLGTAARPGDPEAPSDDPADSNNSMSALALDGASAYVGYCGTCDVLNDPNPFQNGLATNVAGDAPAQRATEAGWHIAAAEGLPNRYIDGIAMDPSDPSTVYVTLSGYSRRWTPPGTLDDPMDAGTGHVFRSTDAGESFTDVTGDLPDLPTTDIEVRGDQLIVATDLGVYLSEDLDGSSWSALGTGLPNVAISTIELPAHDPDLLVAATYGRGVYTYRFANPPEVRRLSGPSRIETAIEIARDAFAGGADAAVLARADEYADALAGAPFARSVDAPLLLTPSNELAPGVAAELERLGASTVYLLGGTAALEPSVASALEARDVDVVRIGGSNRFDTARLIAAQIGGSDVYLTEGANPDPSRGWPDALAVAPLAARQQRPILLATAGSLPPETAQALDERAAETVTVVGGPVAVGEEVLAAVSEVAPAATVERVAGATRYETSAMVADLMVAEGLDPGRPWLAQGGNWPDALASGPAVAVDGGVLVLVDPRSLDSSPATRDWLTENVAPPPLVRILGGTEAISTEVEDALRALAASVAAAAVQQ